MIVLDTVIYDQDLHNTKEIRADQHTRPLVLIECLNYLVLHVSAEFIHDAF